MLISLFLVFINVLTLIVGQFISEYEVSKLRHPDIGWISTPTALDLTLSIPIIILSIINLGMLYFVVTRRLNHHQKRISLITLINILLIMALVFILRERFLPILWPSL